MGRRVEEVVVVVFVGIEREGGRERDRERRERIRSGVSRQARPLKNFFPRGSREKFSRRGCRKNANSARPTG